MLENHRFKLLIFNPLAGEYIPAIRDAFPDLDIVSTTDASEFDRHIRDCNVVLSSRFPVQSLKHAHRLKWIQSTNSGVDFLTPVREDLKRIVVTNARGIHAEVMSDYVLGALTMLHWDFPQLLRQQAAREWKSKLIDPLSSKTIGIVGLGSVGLEIARRAKSIGMTVLGMRRGPARETEPVDEYYSREQLAEFLSRSDFVVLIVAATPETHKLIAAKEFAVMKRSARLVNISRGTVVDEAALVNALSSGEIAGAVLDVFEVEPLPDKSPLWEMSNVIVTSHIAGNPTEYSRRVLGIFLENIRRYVNGESLLNVVDIDKGY